jgi:hypothetical protein
MVAHDKLERPAATKAIRFIHGVRGRFHSLQHLLTEKGEWTRHAQADAELNDFSRL